MSGKFATEVNVHIDLLEATPEQRARFVEPELAKTLAAIRQAVGDPTAPVRVSTGPSAAIRTVVYMIQSAEVLPSVQSPWPHQTCFDGRAQNEVISNGESQNGQKR